MAYLPPVSQYQPRQASFVQPSSMQMPQQPDAAFQPMMAQPIAANSLQQPRFTPANAQSNPNYLKDIITSYQTKQQTQQDQGGFIQNILSARFQPNQNDQVQAYNRNTDALYAPHVFKATTPEEVAMDRAKLELAPYSTAATFKSAFGKNSGGATGELVDRLMTENPGMTFQAALQQVQTGFRQGTQYDANGNIIATPGVADARGQIKRGEQRGTEQGKLEYAAPIAGATASGKTEGEARANAQIDLPRVIDNATYAVKKIAELRDHPELDSVVGLRSMIPVMPSTGGADALARFKQITGQNFLAAYETLKGGGQITEVEGQKATEAIARLDRAQDKATIQAAMNDLISVINLGVERARLKAGMQDMSVGRPSYVPKPTDPNAAMGSGGNGWSVKRVQ